MTFSTKLLATNPKDKMDAPSMVATRTLNIWQMIPAKIPEKKKINNNNNSNCFFVFFLNKYKQQQKKSKKEKVH